MTQNTNILQELKQLQSLLADAVLENPYQVPNGYFEGLAGQVLNRIRAMDAKTSPDELSLLSPMVNDISREMPYSLPAGYFEQLQEKLLPLVREKKQTSKEELEELSPLLSRLNRQMPFSVPENYFDQLPAKALPERKVVAMASRKWFRYTAAAIVTGVVATIGFFTLVKPNPEKSLAKFEKKLNKEIKKMSDQELADFVQSTSVQQDIVAVEPKEEVKELLKDIPVSELQKFLDETSDPGNSLDDLSAME